MLLKKGKKNNKKSKCKAFCINANAKKKGIAKCKASCIKVKRKKKGNNKVFSVIRKQKSLERMTTYLIKERHLIDEN